jgi:uncharacterized protein
VGFVPYVLLVLLPTLIISGWAAWRVRSTYAKWSQVDSGLTMSPFQFARYLLDRNGLQQVRVEPTPGQLTDHYDPRTRTLRVSNSTAGGRDNFGRFDPREQSIGLGYAAEPQGRLSVAAAAVIAHEVGHAAQHAEGDAFMSLRQLVVPVAQIGSTIAPWLIIAGVIFRLTDLAILGLIFFAAAVVFMFITLPVEMGASRRALKYLTPIGLVGQREEGARAVLSAAGWTYVAAALTAILTFLYYATLVFGGRR